MSHGGSALFINNWGEDFAPFNKCAIFKTQTNKLFPARPWVLDTLRINPSIKWLYQSTSQSSGKKLMNQCSCSKIPLQGEIWKGQELLRVIFTATSGDLLSTVGCSGWVWLQQTWCNEILPRVRKALSSHTLCQRISISAKATPKKFIVIN